MDHVSETQLQMGGNYNKIIWRLEGQIPGDGYFYGPEPKGCVDTALDLFRHPDEYRDAYSV